MDCTNCPKRADCVELCADAEAYAAQDHTTFPGGLWGIYTRDPAVEPVRDWVTWKDGAPVTMTAADMEGSIIDLALEDLKNAAFDVPLTESQQHVAEGRAAGKTFQEIADAMEVNVSTIHRHWVRIKRKVIKAWNVWSRYLEAMNCYPVSWMQARIARMGFLEVKCKYAKVTGKGIKGRAPEGQLAFLNI